MINIYELFEHKIGILNSIDYEIIRRMLETHSEEEVKKALDISYQNGAKNIKYVLKVLETMPKSNIPEWFNKEIKNEPLSEEEKKNVIEVILCLKEWHKEDWEQWSKEQLKNNGLNEYLVEEQ